MSYGRVSRRWRAWLVAAAAVGVAACANEDDTSTSDTSSASSPSSSARDTTMPADSAPSETEQVATSVPAGEERPTIDELLARDEPLVIVHQGAAHDHPSATLYAYGESVRAGADMLELDVQVSADGEIVVIHDTVVDHRTDGEGAVSELTAAELAGLDAGYWFVPGCGACPDRPDANYPYRGVRTGDRLPPEGYTAEDFGVPTLRQVAERFPHMPLDVEIKGGAEGIDTIEPLVAELRDLGLTDSVVIATFDHDVAEAVREHAPEIDVTPGQQGLIDWLGDNDSLDGYRIVQIPNRYDGLGDVLVPEILDRLRAEGFAIWVWIDGDEQTPELYEDISDRGVDAILADRVEQLRRIVDER